MKADPKWLHGKDRKAAIALMKVYGDDTDAILNGLHAISARIAIGAGCTPERFAAGVKHHWDFIVAGINGTCPSCLGPLAACGGCGVPAN